MQMRKHIKTDWNGCFKAANYTIASICHAVRDEENNLPEHLVSEVGLPQKQAEPCASSPGVNSERAHSLLH